MAVFRVLFLNLGGDVVFRGGACIFFPEVILYREHSPRRDFTFDAVRR